MASDLKFLQPFHHSRIDDCQRPACAIAVAYINAARYWIVAHVVRVRVDAKVQGFNEHKGLRIVETQLARLARHGDPVYARHINGGLRVFDARNRAYALPRIHDLDGVVAKRRDDQIGAFAIPSVMVQASIDTGQRDAGSQRQRWGLVEFLRLRRVLLGVGLAEDECRKPGSHDHARHCEPSDVPKGFAADAFGKFNRPSPQAGTATALSRRRKYATAETTVG